MDQREKEQQAWASFFQMMLKAKKAVTMEGRIPIAVILAPVIGDGQGEHLDIEINENMAVIWQATFPQDGRLTALELIAYLYANCQVKDGPDL